MEWMNIHIAKQLRSPACVGSSPAELGTWILCLGYCCEQENGGRIVGAAKWKDRQLQRAIGVTITEVRAADRLLTIEGDDILVNGYPETKVANVQRLRGQSQAAALRRWGKRDGQCQEAEPQGMPYGIPQGMPNGNAEGEGEGERKGNTPAAAAAVVAPETPAGSDGARQVIQGMDRKRIQRAVANADPLEIIAAFGGTRDEKRDPEWTRDATGLIIGELVAVFWRAQQNRSAIRQPSGLRAQREDWNRQPLPERKGWIREAFADLGIPMPAPRKPQAEGEGEGEKVPA